MALLLIILLSVKTIIPPTTEVSSVSYSVTALPPTTTVRAITTEVLNSTVSENSARRGLYLDDDLLLGTQDARGLPSTPPTRGDDSTSSTVKETTSAPATTLAPMGAGDADLALKKAETPEGYWAWIPDSWQDALKGGCNQGS
jgi:hypothetical protein